MLQCCVSKFAIFYPLVNTVIAVNGQWQQNNEGINDDRFTEVLIKIDDCDGDTDSDDSDNNDDTFANETSHPSSGLDNLQRISEKGCNGCRGGTFFDEDYHDGEGYQKNSILSPSPKNKHYFTEPQIKALSHQARK